MAALQTSAGHGFLVDELKAADSQSLLENVAKHYLQISQKQGDYTEYFSCPGGEKIKVDKTNIRYIPVYREENSGNMLVLVNPKERESALAFYLNGTWWPVDDILTSSDPSKEGLIQVCTFGERIALFVLNYLVCGFLEEDGSEDGVCFLPHATDELAKILWHQGEAVAFYTYKNKGSLCNSNTCQCYLLPVLDTMFVRKRWRRHGLGTRMLQDYSQTFPQESDLGISYPISPAMYQVCHKFLLRHPKYRNCLWEVEAPGYFSQRINVWLRIQLGEAPEVEESTLDTATEPRNKEVSIQVGDSQDLPHKGDSLQSVGSTDVLVTSQVANKRRSPEESLGETVSKQMKTS